MYLKSKKPGPRHLGGGGANLRGGGPGMLELQNFFKMKDFFAENFGNFWKKVVLRKILGTFVFGKILLSGKFFFGGPTPQPETGWHGPVKNLIFINFFNSPSKFPDMMPLGEVLVQKTKEN